MYMLFKSGRPISNLKFDSYEKCRSWARKLLRRQDYFLRTFDDNDYEHRNPSLRQYGYTIRSI